MASDIVSCFGINTQNLSKETSTVSTFPISKNPILKFDEGLIQQHYKLRPSSFLFKYDQVSSNYQYSIFSYSNTISINDQTHSFESPILDMQAYQSTLYILQDSLVSIYKLPQIKVFKTYTVPSLSSSIKVRNFGDLVYIQSPNSILRIDSLNYTHTQNFAEQITAIDSIFGSDSQICVCLITKELKIIDFCTSEISTSFKTPEKIDQIFSVSEKVIFLYSLNTLYSFSCENEEITYSIVFNSRVTKVIRYCEETEQFIILNKNYCNLFDCKLFVLSLDEDARVSKFITFALNAPGFNFFHLVQANDVPDQALYEGNSLHKLWIVHEKEIAVYELEVVSTKTVGFRYGPQLEGINLPASYLTGQVDEGAAKGSFVNDEKARLKFFEIPGESGIFDSQMKTDPSPVKVFQPSQTIAGYLPAREKGESVDLKLIEKCIKTELSSEKVNIITSQIAFKLEEILPESVKNAFSQAAPGIANNVREIVRSSIPDLRSLLTVGLGELKTLQQEIFSALEALSYSPPRQQPGPESRASVSSALDSSSTLKQIIESRDEDTYKRFIAEGSIKQMVIQTAPEELFELGDIVFELSLQGNQTAAAILQVICENIPGNNSKFPAFYVKISNTSSTLIRESQIILEKKF